MILKKAFYVGVALVVFSSCQKKEKDTLFSLLPASYTGVAFVNSLTENDSLNLILNEYLYNGGGVAVGDINNDNLPDLFFSGNMVSSKLYLNKGNCQFTDITEAAGTSTTGWSTGVNMVDINADGFLDIYVCVAGTQPAPQRANKLFINNKNLTFTEQSKAYQLADTSYSTQAAFLDYDRDGDLDMYLLNHVLSKEANNPNLIRPKLTNGENPNTDKLFRNDYNKQLGHPVFTDVSKQTGIAIEGYGLGVAVSDLNQDGWPDIYVCNDYLSNDLLWINNKNGTFSNRIADFMKHQSNSAMGNDVADIDNDGLQDVLTLDMMPEDNYHRKMMHVPATYDRRELENQMGYQQQQMRNMLQIHQGFKPNGDPYFSETGYLSGVFATDWSWSALLADFDNDGLRDIHITNGFVHDLTNGDFILFRQRLYNTKIVSDQEYIKQLMKQLNEIPGRKLKNYFYKNTGQLGFKKMTDEWGISEPSYSNGAAYSDLDNDGDLDIVTNNINDSPFILRNNLIAENQKTNADSLNYLSIKLVGNDQNLNGLGAIIKVVSDGNVKMIEQNPCRGFMSSIENRMHLGLGKNKKIDSLYVLWPNGFSQVLKNVVPNEPLILYQKNAKPDYNLLSRWKNPLEKQPILFSQCNEALGIDYQHKEEKFIDYNTTPLIHQKYSQLGPGIAVGDINGDRLDDFYVGNGYKHSGEFFIQQKNGTFKSKILTTQTKFEEDMGSIFFDADGDNDLDLYVVSGTSEFDDGSPYQQDRLYKNDGKGNFKLDTNALPPLTTSGSCVVAGDIDNDGDLDLFVGGRQMPGQYPLTPTSFLLQNNRGKFVNITSTVAPELQHIGMVTTALWTDFDNDGQVDLLLAGEWMAIEFFKNTNGKLKRIETNITKQSVGWWNSIKGADFDNDGDTDYVLGNLGLNSKYKASTQYPLQMRAADFDNNRTIDPLMGYALVGKNGKNTIYPSPQREVMVAAMPQTRFIFNSYDLYANIGFDDFISKLKNKPVFSADVTELRSVYLENQGKNKFLLRPLPTEAQIAPQFGMVIGDYNGDENLDVLLVGNSYSADVITGRYDASYGVFLAGDGRGQFKTLKNTGFLVEGDCKGMGQLHDAKHNSIVIVGINDAKMLAFKASNYSYPNAPIPDKRHGWVKEKRKNGQFRKVETYYGSGYLSQ